MATNKLPALVPQIYEHEQFGKIRVIGDSDNPLFCLSDLCKMLGIGNPSQVKTRLDDGVISNEVIPDSMGRNQNVTFVNEDGLYDLILESRKPILESRKPEARKMRKWLTSEVVPSIRKTGMYINPNAPINPDLLIKIGQDMKALAAQRDEALAQVAELKPKADYTEAVLQSDEHLTSEIIAKEYGKPAQWLHEKLRDLKKMYKRGRNWHMYQPYAGEGYRDSETVTLARGKTVMNYYWTQKGRNFIYNTLKEQGIVPVVEREDPATPLF